MNSNLQIIGLLGRAGVGKTTAAAIINSHNDFCEIPLAGEVKHMASILLGVPRDRLEGVTPESRIWRELPLPDIDGKTPRQILQGIGNGLRELIHPDIWVNMVIREIREKCDVTRFVKWTKFLIPDVRYENEIIRLKQAFPQQVRIIAITRNGIPRFPIEDTVDQAINRADDLVMNNGSLEEFREIILKVKDDKNHC